MTNYKIYGSYELPRKRNNTGCLVLDTSKEKLQEFWDLLDSDCEGLTDAVGCYLFGVQSGSSVMPWYVGQAKKGF